MSSIFPSSITKSQVMKNRKAPLLSVLLTVAGLSAGIDVSFAATSQDAPQIDPVQRRAARTTHDERKAAAHRLKAVNDEARHKALFNDDGTPKGHDAHGYTGKGKSHVADLGTSNGQGDGHDHGNGDGKDGGNANRDGKGKARGDRSADSNTNAIGGGNAN
jgi:hypothetical protein